MRITPGYNFTQHETPTKAKLQAMVDGMTLTAIDVSQISAAILVTYSGDTQISLPQIGTMRHDPLNRLWIRTLQGNIPIFRANWGGMETNRFQPKFDVTGGVSSLPTKVGNGRLIVGLGAANSDPTTFSGTLAYIATAANPPALGLQPQETGVSLTYIRALLRGGWNPNGVTSYRTKGIEYMSQAQQIAASTCYDPDAFPIDAAARISIGICTREWRSSHDGAPNSQVRNMCWFWNTPRGAM